MADTPERIWIEQDDCPYFYEESELAEVGSPVTEYIRADLCPRPAPASTDMGLVTVGEVSTVRESVAAFAGHMLSRKLKPGDLLCLRSQAEELLAAEREAQQRLLDIIEEANDDKEALETQLAAAEKALEPFAEYGEDYFDKDYNGKPLPDKQGVGWVYLNYGHFRKARAVLGGKPS